MSQTKLLVAPSVNISLCVSLGLHTFPYCCAAPHQCSAGLSVLKVREHSAAPAAPGLWQLLPDPPSQPEVSHRCCDLHGRSAEEAGHGRHGEMHAEQELVSSCLLIILSRTLLQTCTVNVPLYAQSTLLIQRLCVFPTDDRRLAVHRSGGRPSLPLAVCHHHHTGHPGHVLGRQFKLHTRGTLPMKDKMLSDTDGTWCSLGHSMFLLPAWNVF